MHHIYIPQKRNKKKILKEFSKKKKNHIPPHIAQRNKMRMIQISNWNNSSENTGSTFKYVQYPVYKTFKNENKKI